MITGKPRIEKYDRSSGPGFDGKRCVMMRDLKLTGTVIIFQTPSLSLTHIS